MVVKSSDTERPADHDCSFECSAPAINTTLIALNLGYVAWQPQTCAKANLKTLMRRAAGRPGLLRQQKLQSTRFNSAGNTDSEVESPLSQPLTHKRFSPTVLQSELQVQSSSFSAAESAATPVRNAPQTSSALRESVADSPESVAMSTPECGQAPPSSEASPPVLMSCSSAGAKSTNHINIKAPLPFGSPMCMSPDTWATPQQLQWELSAESVTALSASPQVPSQVPSPTASQLQAANLDFGFDAIKAAGVGSSGAGVKSRLASSTLADQLSESPSGSGDRDRAYGGFDRDAEWMEDLEVTQSQSLPPSDEQEGCSNQEALCLTLDSDEEPCCLEDDPLGLDASQLPAMSPRQPQKQTDVPHGLSQPSKRANSSEHARDEAAATVSPEKKLHAAGLPAHVPEGQGAEYVAHQPSSSGVQAADKQQEIDGASTPVREIVKVFCEEAGSDAGYFRQFVAASYGRFWARYAPRLGQRPHCYEVVKGGAPCHLYFDTEFATECNPGVDGEALLDKLLLACTRVFREQFQVDLQPEWVYELDSSHSGKFSRHLILCIPGMSFVNNWAVGHLVGQILAEPEGMEILVRKKSDQAGTEQFTSLVDTAVYTRNRHFRLIWSCKAGKTHVLTPTPRFATAPSIKRSHRELFLDTLICNVEPNARLLLADIVPTGLSFPSSHHPHISGGSRHVGYVVHGQHEVKVAHKCDAFDSSSDAIPLTQERVQAWAEQAAGHVEEVATFRAGGLPASVRTVAHCGFTGTVAYSLVGPGSHYCEHIGRCHQSNRVFFVVNFLTGMLAQKCHDPDCSHFRSTWTPLLPHMLNLDR
ncbi:hypothetical protein WJX82_010519 [Trebouxia sp. C0006]